MSNYGIRNQTMCRGSPRLFPEKQYEPGGPATLAHIDIHFDNSD